MPSTQPDQHAQQVDSLAKDNRLCEQVRQAIESLTLDGLARVQAMLELEQQNRRRLESHGPVFGRR